MKNNIKLLTMLPKRGSVGNFFCAGCTKKLGSLVIAKRKRLQYNGFNDKEQGASNDNTKFRENL
ncbi:hypothetical protein [Lactococcus taiwanensis]|uniref:hypothetical protein n=1 Tax=Lactococcus taiwanensis TaxID=1151742 RepID=UPI001965A23E|nr:hypothetical protein [Lactococcus taiwanensis]QRZ10389.1 hypothetical protein JVB21_06215 [Lactococcus taiwanensis]